MKKMTCILGCVTALLLVGCQMQPNPVNTETSPAGNGENDGAKNDNVSNVPGNEPTIPNEIGGDSDSLGKGDLDTVTITDMPDCELKAEGSLRGEIEVTHKLSVGKMELSEGDTALFSPDALSASAELKIILIGAQTGTILEGSVTGSDDLSFEIEIADEYTVVLENCGRSAVQFTIDYSIGGSK